MRSQHKRRVSSYRWRPRLESLEGRLAPGTCFRASGVAALHTPHGVEESIQHAFVSSWFLQMEREKKMRGETCYSETNPNARHAVTESTRIETIACSSSSRLEVAARERFLESPIQLSLEDPHFCDSMWVPELDRAVPIKGALASADSRTPATDVFLGDAKNLGAPSTRTGMVRQFDSGIALSRPQYVAASQLLSSSVKAARWIWSTFEHVDNAPDAGETMLKPRHNFNDPTKPQPTSGFGFRPPTNDPVANPTTPTQITRVLNNNLITAPWTKNLNAAMQTRLAGTVWENYRLVSTQWPAPRGGPIIPCQLTNTVAETYIQNDSFSASCMRCHGVAQTAGTTKAGQTRPANFSYLLQMAQPVSE